MLRILIGLGLCCSAVAMHINNTEVNNTFNTPDENGTLPVFVGTLETNYLFGRTEKGCLCNSSWFVSFLSSFFTSLSKNRTHFSLRLRTFAELLVSRVRSLLSRSSPTVPSTVQLGTARFSGQEVCVCVCVLIRFTMTSLLFF